MELSKKESEEKPRNLWKGTDESKYWVRVIIFTINNYNIIEFYNVNNNDFLIIDLKRYITSSSIDSTIESEEIDDKVVCMEDLEKRKDAYGICGECNEPGTGKYWCQPCN